MMNELDTELQSYRALLQSFLDAGRERVEKNISRVISMFNSIFCT